ncbi:hypothetical protein [Mumia sp. Pv 4-285]|uniref:hypothetical protein n=1 Tax=Mumia qirimensis TaxID=3234852 RepID=UPI00351D1FEA
MDDEIKPAPGESNTGQKPHTGGKTEFRYTPTCTPGDGTDTTCSVAYTCPPDQVRYNVWRREPGGEWQPSGTVCRGGSDAAETPVVTAADVLREVRRLPLPRVAISIQPAGRTLVNLDTVFSTTPPTFDHTITILEQRVDVTATPRSYTWHYGDGSTETTDGPGRPYPATDITHRYTDAGQTVRPRVSVTFTISYSVDGGPTETLDETITTDGPAETLTTHEAVPVLTG